MSNLKRIIIRDFIQTDMTILYIHNGSIDIGKVLQISPHLLITICDDRYGWANTIHRIYFLPACDFPVDGIYLCPGEIADRLVFFDSFTEMKVIPEE